MIKHFPLEFHLLSPAELSLAGKLGAHKSWAKTENRSARTHPARMAFRTKFERQVDPNNELLPAERAKRAEHARKAFYAELALPNPSQPATAPESLRWAPITELRDASRHVYALCRSSGPTLLAF